MDNESKIMTFNDDNKVKLYEITVTLQPDNEDEEIEKTYMFAKPSVQSFNRYINNVSKNMMNASKTLLKDNIVDEQISALESDWNEYPAIVLSLVEKLLYSMGLAKSSNFKRL